MTEQVRQVAGDVQKRAGEVLEQASEKAEELYEQASDWAGETYEKATGWASDAARRGSREWNEASDRSVRNVRSAGTGVQRFITDNPVMVGIVGLAAGLLIGALLPRTRREDETFGSWADEVRDQGVRYARDATQRGREFVEETFSGEDPRFAQHESDYRTRRPSNQGGGRRP